MSNAITTTATGVGVDLIAVQSRNPFEPEARIMRRPYSARAARDGRGVTYTWTASPPAEGERVDGVDLSAFWHADRKCYIATAMPVKIEIDHGMTITCIENLIGGPTVTVRSQTFPRFNRRTLDVFADSARVWLQRMADLA